MEPKIIFAKHLEKKMKLETAFAITSDGLYICIASIKRKDGTGTKSFKSHPFVKKKEAETVAISAVIAAELSVLSGTDESELFIIDV